MCRISSLDQRSVSWGFLGGGDRALEPLGAPFAEPASDVDDTSTGESRSYSANGGDGDPDADAVASTNFSANKKNINYSLDCYKIEDGFLAHCLFSSKDGLGPTVIGIHVWNILFNICFHMLLNKFLIYTISYLNINYNLNIARAETFKKWM